MIDLSDQMLAALTTEEGRPDCVKAMNGYIRYIISPHATRAKEVWREAFVMPQRDRLELVKMSRRMQLRFLLGRIRHRSLLRKYKAQRRTS